MTQIAFKNKREFTSKAQNFKKQKFHLIWDAKGKLEVFFYLIQN